MDKLLLFVQNVIGSSKDNPMYKCVRGFIEYILNPKTLIMFMLTRLYTFSLQKPPHFFAIFTKKKCCLMFYLNAFAISHHPRALIQVSKLLDIIVHSLYSHTEVFLRELVRYGVLGLILVSHGFFVLVL